MPDPRGGPLHDPLPLFLLPARNNVSRQECLFKAFEKWVSSWQKDLRVVFILHVHVLTGDVLCGASPGYFPLYVAHPIHTSCVHISIKLCGYRIPRARPRRLFERPDHLTKIDTLRHCCDQQRTSSLTQTQRLLQHHAGCRFCGGSATESAHDGTIQMATTTWPVDGGNLSGFRVR